MNKKTCPWLRFIEGPDGKAAPAATGAKDATASPNEVAEAKEGSTDEVGVHVWWAVGTCSR